MARKAFEKIKAGLEQALRYAQGDHSVGRVTSSCGCVFCDMGLTPDAEGRHGDYNLPCTKGGPK